MRGTPPFQRESWRVEPRIARSVGSPPAKEGCPDLSGRGGQFPDTMMSWWQVLGWVIIMSPFSISLWC